MSRMRSRLTALEQTQPKEKRLFTVHLIGPDSALPAGFEDAGEVVNIIRLVRCINRGQANG